MPRSMAVRTKAAWKLITNWVTSPGTSRLPPARRTYGAIACSTSPTSRSADSLKARRCRPSMPYSASRRAAIASVRASLP